MLHRLLLLTAWPSLIGLAAMVPAMPKSQSPAVAPGDPMHIWAGVSDSAHVEAWTNSHLAAEQQAIDHLLAVKGTRTVENTLAPFDLAQQELSLANAQTYLMYAVSPDKAVRDTANNMVQKVSAASTALSLNQDVYHALVALDVSHADAATQYYVKRTLLEYRLAGVDKDEATRKRVQELQNKITQISLLFGKNVQEDVRTVLVDSPDDLAGLPPDFVAGHKPGPDGKIHLTTDFPDMLPVLTYAKSADLRHRMFLAYTTRAYPANRQVLLDLLTARQELASTLGFAHWADLATADQMVGSAANVRAFLHELDVASKVPAAREYKMVMDFARRQQPGLQNISMDSRMYWNEQYRRQYFNFDSQSVRPYFPYEQVQQGILDTAARLFHLEFRQDKNAVVWDPSVTAWDVYDRGPARDAAHPKLLGRFYLDMHPREGKDKWFSAYPVSPGDGGANVPEGALICNFPGGKPGDPGLMQYSDVVTFFHEFGHLMHGVLGGQQRWAGQRGIATEGDFVEAPSQMLEEFFRNAKLLQSFAKDPKTGQPIPTEMVERMNRASAFGRGDWVRAQLFYTRYSFDLHDVSPQSLDLDALEKADFAATLPYSWVEGDRLYASFTHLVGYSSNYYTYLYDKVIALDFFSQFDPDNLINGPAALRYRHAVLKPGGSEPGTELVKNFLGRPQNLKAFEAWMNEEFAGEKK